MGRKWVSQVMFIHNKSSAVLTFIHRLCLCSWSWHCGDCRFFSVFQIWSYFLLWLILYLNMVSFRFNLFVFMAKCEKKVNNRGSKRVALLMPDAILKLLFSMMHACMYSICVSYSVCKYLPVFLRHITWKSVERRSVMASTADIQVNANRGRTTQELHRDALSEKEKRRQTQRGKEEGKEGEGTRASVSNTRPVWVT